jgi:hypothetical protein
MLNCLIRRFEMNIVGDVLFGGGIALDAITLNFLGRHGMVVNDAFISGRFIRFRVHVTS